ncbi:two component, sigma54 specific, transcriptional regulator, Fis family [Nitrosococcus oceani ATCC 19707]|uniref:Two component, sigma54 specific, transcriptional regulator, Fis family n=1 Tax=Nitrosococcus oceani (strain ATCC 19707 / BCRC 17464 / JCM 30415 / NCIMB 11848 / C-107) TaxID=323261 RepID=Q3J6T5_NITOC|nr:sigma-54 dependent transcriptional regulator [Nitrosococcus oceani]ABA59461.1 two component, sigma54 specific, transcriptional regulator, Fis family [Nitrosococcus oceani ATCC 19707]GEM19969.1 sigma-54-dependent Fis family transcriptional regulator [Nitrosococcus oceani]
MTVPHILVVDDEPDIRILIREILEDENYRVSIAENGTTARQVWQNDPPDLLLLDIWIPDIDGISLLREWIQGHPKGAPVIMMSGHGTVETAVQAIRLGAVDYIEKPLSMAKLLLTVEKTLATSYELPSPSKIGERSPPLLEPAGKSLLMTKLREQARRMADDEAPILLIGEPGSGKNPFAQYLHAVRSSRCEGPFTAVDIASLKPESQDLELFGESLDHQNQPGILLEEGRRGTVFLNGIEALSPISQRRLYGLIDTAASMGTITSEQRFPRLVAATSVDLLQLVEAGRFQEDLFYQLSVLPLAIPPLREHPEDIPELLNYFVNLLVEQEGYPYRHFSVAAQNRLRNYNWPGNVQELRNLVRRLLIIGGGTEIGLAEVEASLKPISITGTPLSIDLGLPLREAREQFERLYLEHKLRETGGNVGKAAKLVEMERTHLYRKLRALGIDAKQLGNQE